MDIISLIPQFGGVFMTLLAFVVALSVIVAIHEYGHYIVGRWSGIKADVFSLGFGPVIWSRVDQHGTRWQVALLPLGGYVKFMGDADAASGKDADAMQEMPPEIKRQTMHGAPLWARALTVAAGPVFNFILAIIVFSALVMINGKTADPLTVGELRQLPPANYTLQPGDEVVEIAGQRLPGFDENVAFSDFIDQMPTDRVVAYKVRREGELINVTGPQLMPTLAVRITPKSAAYSTGLEAGDVITAIEGQEVNAFSQLKDVVESSNGRALQLKVWRDGELHDFVLQPRRRDEPQPEGGFKTHWRIGIAGGLAFEPQTEPLGPGKALMAAFSQTGRIISGSMSGLYHMVTGAISSCNMSGPIGIAQVSGAMASQGTQSFIEFIAFLSVAIGLLNLFPVPVLDGGHLVFYAYEAVAGKPPSDRVLRILMTTGLVLILSLMVFALSNDLFCP